MAQGQETSMQRFKPGCGDNKLLRGGEAAARREEDHEEERSLYHFGRAHGLDHDVVLRGPGFVDEDFLLLRVPRRPHARGLHGLRCVGGVFVSYATLLQPQLWR